MSFLEKVLALQKVIKKNFFKRDHYQQQFCLYVVFEKKNILISRKKEDGVTKKKTNEKTRNKNNFSA